MRWLMPQLVYKETYTLPIVNFCNCTYIDPDVTGDECLAAGKFMWTSSANCFLVSISDLFLHYAKFQEHFLLISNYCLLLFNMVLGR